MFPKDLIKHLSSSAMAPKKNTPPEAMSTNPMKPPTLKRRAPPAQATTADKKDATTTSSNEKPKPRVPAKAETPSASSAAKKKGLPAGATGKKPNLATITKMPSLETTKSMTSVDDRDLEISRLHEEVADLKLKLQTANLREDGEEVQRLKLQAEELQTELRANEAEISTLRRTADSQTKKTQEMADAKLVAYKQKASASLQTLQVQLVEREAEASKAAESAVKIAQLEQEAAVSQEKVTASARRMRLLELEVEQNEGNTARIADLERELTNARATMDSFAELISDLEDQLDVKNAAKDVEGAGESLVNQLQLQIVELSHKLTVAVKDSREKDSRIKEQTKELTEARSKVHKLECWADSAAGEKRYDPTAKHSPEDLVDALSIKTNEVVDLSEFDPLTTPSPPDVVQVNITIDPVDRKSWTLLQRARAAMKKSTTFKISGPPTLVKELETKLKELEEDHDFRIQEIMRLQQRLIHQELDIEALEQQPNCVVPEHKQLEEQVVALSAQVGLHVETLRTQGARLRKAQKEQEERELLEKARTARAFAGENRLDSTMDMKRGLSRHSQLDGPIDAELGSVQEAEEATDGDPVLVLDEDGALLMGSEEDP
ncbi:hypothetical protein P154DRAFT_137748 [Amniculicola lignicola CBS 123094]|uniref:Uncharacterized protein n=1 Tax=Amniculicola lignicola CBS 123094 TaxID=1392246 RepID=A0A6A5VSR3_9PLEO|nr:hypothetical protein P154DRAFT_137748 [Amniculicola lignicola CBS 123094]